MVGPVVRGAIYAPGTVGVVQEDLGAGEKARQSVSINSWGPDAKGGERWVAQ